ncbi:hypothetical protein PIROE2DRAFT_2034, partial [Piromyces sp. E2]
DCNDNNNINKFNEEELDSNSSISSNINNNDTNSINSQDGNITITVDNKVIVLDRNKINLNRLLNKENSDIINNSGDLLFLSEKYKTRLLNSFICCDTRNDTMTNNQSRSSNANTEEHTNMINNSPQQENSALQSSNSNSMSRHEKNSKYIKDLLSSQKEQNIAESKNDDHNDENNEILHNTLTTKDLEDALRNNNYIKNLKTTNNNSSYDKINENKNDINHSINLSKILLRNKTNLDENDIQENIIMKMDDIDTIFKDDDNTSLAMTENGSLARTIAELNNNNNNIINNNTSNRMTASSIKSINNMCHNLMTTNNQKVVHIRNNKLLLENKELREKVRMLNEKLAYHQISGKSLENLKKKLPPLKNTNGCSEYGKQKKYSDIFKLPSIQNRSTSIVEVKDSNNNGSNRLKSSIPTKSKMPIINRKNNNVISNNSNNSNNSSYETSLDKINKIKNNIINKNDNRNENLLSSSSSRNSSYYQKLYDSSKTMVKMDSDISRKNYKIKLKQDIENLDQEINNCNSKTYTMKL